jgi:DHA2 family multidrug resistance protein
VTAAAPPLERRGESHKYVIAFAVVIASMMQIIDSSIVNVAIPHMMGNLGASLDEIAWVSTGYILASVIVIPLTGFFAAFFGRKRYFVGSILLFTAASVFCGASHSLEALVFWRIVQGLGGGALVSTSQAVLFEAFPREEVGTAMALFGMGIMVGPTLGPTLGGYITDNYSWPWIFYVNVPIGIFAAAMVMAYVLDHPHHERTRHVDYWGIGLLTVSAGSLQYLLEYGQREDWFDSGLIIALAVVGVVGSALLVWRELTAERPAIDLRVLRHRQMWVGTVLGVMVSVSLFGSVFVLPVFLQGTLHMTAWQTGMIILPGALATAVSMAFSGKISRYLDARFLVASGSIFFFASMWMLSRITAQSGTGDFFWPLILRGLGLGVVFVPLTTLTLAGLDLKEIPQATGVSNFFRQLGASLGIALMATLLVHYTQESRAVLATHVSWYDVATRLRLDQLAHAFVARGADALTAQSRALAVVQGQVLQQVSVLAFSRLYLLSGLVLVLSMPLLLLLEKPRVGAGRPGPMAAE